MATTFALMIQPAEADADRTDFADTFASVDPEAPALSVGELAAGAATVGVAAVAKVNNKIHARSMQGGRDRSSNTFGAARNQSDFRIERGLRAGH